MPALGSQLLLPDPVWEVAQGSLAPESCPQLLSRRDPRPREGIKPGGVRSATGLQRIRNEMHFFFFYLQGVKLLWRPQEEYNSNISSRAISSPSR